MVLEKRRNVVQSLRGTKWGCDHRTLRSTHLAYIQAKADYAMPAYGPFLQPKELDALRVEQNNAARTMSGCPRGTREPVALMEADLRTVHQR
eukprot:gene11731-biopygen5016